MGFTLRSRRFLISLLFCAATAQGAIAINGSGVKSDNTGATSWAPTYPAAISSGHYAILLLAMDNAGSAGANAAAPTTASDNAGNSYTRRIDGIYDNGAASAGVEVAVYSAKIATAVTTSNTITFTWISGVSVTAKAMIVKDLTVGAGKALGFVTGAAFTCGTCTTGTPSITTGTIPVGDLTVGVCGAESADTFTIDSDSTNGTWDSTNVHTGVGSGTSGMSVDGQGKVQTTTNSTQQFNPTLTSVDTQIAWAEFTETNATTSSGAMFFFP